jgi:uncharacterized membrane protein
VTFGTLLFGVALKANCLDSWVSGNQPKGCYNDIQYLWHTRQMAEHVLPYQGDFTRVYHDGELVSVRLGAGQIEYPVVTGVFAWLTALPVSGHTTYLVVNMLVLAPFALLTVAMLFNLVGRRSYLFAAAPALAAYAFLNWDLLPVAATVGALWVWRRGHVGWTGVLLALGACAKIWPGFLLAPLLLALVVRRRAADGGRLVAAAVATGVAVNLPFLVADPSGWWAPYLMQSVRQNDRTTNSIWYWLFRGVPFHDVATWSAVAVVLAWAAVLAAGYAIGRRAEGPGAYPWLQVGAAMVSTYVIVGRVDSPQYGLWLLPFVVLLGVPTGWVVAFVATDLFLWLQWSWLWGSPDWLMGVAVAARFLVLAGLSVVFLVSPTRWVDGRTDGPAPLVRAPATPAGGPEPTPTPAPRR